MKDNSITLLVRVTVTFRRNFTITFAPVIMKFRKEKNAYKFHSYLIKLPDLATYHDGITLMFFDKELIFAT